jgi:hypothetical protein
MSKFEKRLSKILKNPQNAIVIGDGFGQLETFIGNFKTVFYINEDFPSTRSKNLVYRNNSIDLHLLPDISAIIFNLSTVQNLHLYKEVWRKHKSLVIIEGEEAINRDLSKSLYETGWGCTSLQGFFHVWEQIK